MVDQLDLFGGPRPVSACPHHDHHHVCEECPEQYPTDHSGFVHLELCKRRLPLRRCMGCDRMRTPGAWNHRDWFNCVECVPLGKVSEFAAASVAAIEGKKKIG